MYLQRKNTAPTIQTLDGIDHSGIVLGLAAPIEDKKNKILELVFYYFHTAGTFSGGKQPLHGIQPMVFRFTSDTFKPAEKDEAGNILRLSFPDYATVRQIISFDENGEMVTSGNGWKTWILNQNWVLDLDGKILGTNWQFPV